MHQFHWIQIIIILIILMIICQSAGEEVRLWDMRSFVRKRVCSKAAPLFTFGKVRDSSRCTLNFPSSFPISKFVSHVVSNCISLVPSQQEQSFACKQCPQKFKLKSQLNNHHLNWHQVGSRAFLYTNLSLSSHFPLTSLSFTPTFHLPFIYI